MSRMSYEDNDEYTYDDSEGDIEMTQDDDDEQELVDDAIDFDVVAEKDKPKSYDIEYKTLSADQVRQAMKADIEHIVSMLGLELPRHRPPSLTETLQPDPAQILLRDFRWNKDQLIDKYLEDPDTVAINSGLAVPAPRPAPEPTKALSKGLLTRSSRKAPSSAPSSQTSSQTSQEPFECPICCDVDPPTVLALKCGHRFCSDCWQAYIQSKIRLEGECNIRCANTDCVLVVPSKFIYDITDKATAERFDSLPLRHYVDNMAKLKYCPAPECTYTISCPAAASKASLATQVPSVTCPEGHTFCFGCSIDSDHRPVICTVAKLWLKKCQDDSETANWIKTNTKECTKCQSTIEKNGGCNHMTCKKCKHEFCWVCMGPWSEHGTQWYNCNRFDDKAAVDARDAQSKSRISLERYLHYYNRWANHEQSARLSADLYSKTEKRMEEMQLTTELTWIEVQFLKKALDEVLRCRMTLKWTYAMAYYLEKDNAKELFEDNQRDLEKAVEDLSELMESPIEPETIPTLRQKITDKTVYVQKRNEIMLDDTANGFREGRWEWNIQVD